MLVKQLGDRNVKLVIEYAIDQEMGSIVLINKETKEEICRRETARKEEYSEINIH